MERTKIVILPAENYCTSTIPGTTAQTAAKHHLSRGRGRGQLEGTECRRGRCTTELVQCRQACARLPAGSVSQRRSSGNRWWWPTQSSDGRLAIDRWRHRRRRRSGDKLGCRRRSGTEGRQSGGRAGRRPGQATRHNTTPV